jgi:predicted alpha/beta-fold hydrolase
MEKIKLNLDSVGFNPVGLFKNGHFQTIYNALFYKPIDLENVKKLEIKIDEKNTIICDYNKSINNSTNTLVILVHGLEGSSQSNYIISTAQKLIKKGFSVLRMNIRNCGGTSHLSETLYNAGLSDDVKKIIDYFIDKYDYKNIFACGFSLGANTVLKMAGEYSSNYPKELKGVVAISPPLDLSESSEAIVLPRNMIYDDHYRKRLIKTYKNKKKFYPDNIDVGILKKIKNLKDFDDYITGPSFGYKNAEEYYRLNSSLKFLPDVNVSTLIIQSKDDPIIPFNSTIKAINLNNENIHFLITEYGGHVGFINSFSASKNDIDRRWAENRVVEFVEEVLKT